MGEAVSDRAVTVAKILVGGLFFLGLGGILVMKSETLDARLEARNSRPIGGMRFYGLLSVAFGSLILVAALIFGASE
jgi:hypothetical protein